MKKNKMVAPALIAAALTPASALLFQKEKAPAQRGDRQARGARTRRAARRALEAKVTQIIIAEYGVDEREVKPGTKLSDFKPDQFAYVDLILGLEKQFGVEIPDAEWEKVQTVRDAFDLVEKLSREREAAAAAARARRPPRVRPAPGNGNAWGTRNSNPSNSNAYNANYANANFTYTGNSNMRGNLNGPSVPDFRIAERKVGDVVILELSGSLSFEAREYELRKTLGRLLNERNRKFVLDLAKFDPVDSSAAAALESSAQMVRRVRGQFKLLKPTTRVKALLASSNLTGAFEIYEDEAAAVASFKPYEGCGTRAPAPGKAYDSRAAVERAIRALVADALGLDEEDVRPDAHVGRDLNADSLDRVELTVRLEEEFCVDIPDEDAKGLELVSHYNRYIWLRVRPPHK